MPVSPGDLAKAVHDAVAAGASDVHLHPKHHRGPHAGRDSLHPDAVAAAVEAVRRSTPQVTVGVTTGAWVEPDPVRRRRLIGSWYVLPDHASVNFHEPGAVDLARTLIAKSIGVEAGLFTGTNGIDVFRASGLAPEVLRVLVEVVETESEAGSSAGRHLVDQVIDFGPPVLLHGEDGSAWPVFDLACHLGLHTRIGLEDVLTYPNGRPAPDNASLITEAVRRCAALTADRPAPPDR